MISFKCPHCSAAFSVAPSLAGKRAKCPKCKSSIEVPTEDFELTEVSSKPARPEIENRHAKTNLGGLAVVAGMASLVLWAISPYAGIIAAIFAIVCGILSFLAAMFESGMSCIPGIFAVLFGVPGAVLSIGAIGAKGVAEVRKMAEDRAAAKTAQESADRNTKEKAKTSDSPQPPEAGKVKAKEEKWSFQMTAEEKAAKAKEDEAKLTPEEKAKRDAKAKEDANEAVRKVHEEMDRARRERERMEAKQKAEAEKKQAEDERAASQLLTIAKQFHASKSYEISLPRLKDIVKKYPDTKAGKEAAELVESHEKKK